MEDEGSRELPTCKSN